MESNIYKLYTNKFVFKSGKRTVQEESVQLFLVLIFELFCVCKHSLKTELGGGSIAWSKQKKWQVRLFQLV